jgi:DNA-directed RNA polymerase subunit K/omega
MSDEGILQDEVTETEESRIPREPAPPIESRFLYVDVAALRAKQLRRGAKPRLTEGADPEHGPKPIKAERIAMSEVRSGLVEWTLPEFQVIFDNR